MADVLPVVATVACALLFVVMLVLVVWCGKDRRRTRTRDRFQAQVAAEQTDIIPVITDAFLQQPGGRRHPDVSPPARSPVPVPRLTSSSASDAAVFLRPAAESTGPRGAPGGIAHGLGGRRASPSRLAEASP